MAEERRKLNHDKLAVLLAGGASPTAAAAECGITPRAVHRRLESAEFRKRVQALRDEMVGAASGKLAAGMAKAADVLIELSETATGELKFKASVKVLELGLKTGDLVDIQRRLADLEARTTAATRPVGGIQS